MNIKKFTLTVPVALIAVLLFFCGAAVPQQKKAKNECENMTISTESTDIDLEAEEFTIPAAVNLECGDIKVNAARLKFSNKTHIADISGRPITVVFGQDVTAEAAKATIDFDKEHADLSGGCKFVQKDDKLYTEIGAESVETDYGDNGWVKSAGEVKINYKNLKPKQEPKKAADGEKKKQMIDIDEGFVTAGAVYYALETRDIEASKTVLMEFKEGAVTADSLKGNLRDKKAALGGGIKGKIRDISFSADRIDIDYGKQEADIWGDVVIERDNGDKFKSKHVWLRYKEGERAMKTSAVQGNIKIDKEKLRPKDGSEKKNSEGGKP